jgi:2''-5'' RNA ligase
MPEQLWLPGLEAPPVPTDGLFFAVFPDTRTATGISKLAQQLCSETRSKSKPLAANRLHVTLLHLGNFAGGLPPARVDAAMSAAASISMEPFSVEFDSAVSFALKPRPGRWCWWSEASLDSTRFTMHLDWHCRTLDLRIAQSRRIRRTPRT